MIDIEAAFEEHFSYVLFVTYSKLSHNEAIAEEITSETFFKGTPQSTASGRTAIYVCGCVKIAKELLLHPR